MAALNHPNILAIHDVGEAPGPRPQAPEGPAVGPAGGHRRASRLKPHAPRPGDSLTSSPSCSTARRCATGSRTGRCRCARRSSTAIQIARGLAAAHDKGLVHRDLKPENIFLLGRRAGEDPRLRPGDERQATESVRRERPSPRLTDPGTVIGTVGYMAPEQVRGQAVDARTDLFALGAVLYEMLSGQRAFSRDTAADTMTAILKEDPPELIGTRAELSARARPHRPALSREEPDRALPDGARRGVRARGAVGLARLVRVRQRCRSSSSRGAGCGLVGHWPSGLVAAVALGMAVERRLMPAATPRSRSRRRRGTPSGSPTRASGPTGRRSSSARPRWATRRSSTSIRPGTIGAEPARATGDAPAFRLVQGRAGGPHQRAV